MTDHERFAVELREQMREEGIRRFGLSPAVLERALRRRSTQPRKARPAVDDWRGSGLIVRLCQTGGSCRQPRRTTRCWRLSRGCGPRAAGRAGRAGPAGRGAAATGMSTCCTLTSARRCATRSAETRRRPGPQSGPPGICRCGCGIRPSIRAAAALSKR